MRFVTVACLLLPLCYANPESDAQIPCADETSTATESLPGESATSTGAMTLDSKQDDTGGNTTLDSQQGNGNSSESLRAEWTSQTGNVTVESQPRDFNSSDSSSRWHFPPERKRFNVSDDLRIIGQKSALLYEIEHVHARYAYATYCQSINDYFHWNCNGICQEEASGTRLRFVRIDTSHDIVAHLTFNPDYKSIYLAYRGPTLSTSRQLLHEGIFSKCDWNSNEPARQPRTVPDAARIHAGFEKTYIDQRLPLLKELFKLSLEYPDYRIIFTGHSSGGVYALYSAVDFFDLYGMQDRISVFTYGSPRSGDKTWCNYVESLPFSPRYYRVVKVGDAIPLMPRSLFYKYAECGNLVEYSKEGVPKLCLEGEVESCKTHYNRLTSTENRFYEEYIGTC